MPPRVVLVGPPGAGKTTVGRLLAQRWGTDFRDTDAVVEADAGKRVADIFVEDGEPAFRALEKAAVRRCLDAFDGVLALGGGAILDGDTRESLHKHCVVFLDVELPDAAKRIGLNRDRPLLLGNPRSQLHALMHARRPLYEEVAVHTVDTNGKPPDDIAREVVEALA
jgi:shikimate kinase